MIRLIVAVSFAAVASGTPVPLVEQELEFDTTGVAFPAGATYRAVQLGNGGAAGEWKVEFGLNNLTTLTHLAQDPPAKPLTFGANAATLFPAQHVPGADHAVLDIHEGPGGSPAFGTFLVVPEHSEATWQKYGVNTLRKREMEHSGGLMAKNGVDSGTNCCTCCAAGSCLSCGGSIAACTATCMADFTGLACLKCLSTLGSCCCCLAYECDFYDEDYCEYYCS